MKVWQVLHRLVFTPRLALYRAARRFVRFYEGYSYEFDRNGEAKFLADLPADKISTIFDVGANVGEWSRIALRQFPNAHIHAFELSEATYRTLTLALGSEPRITLTHIGLSNCEGKTQYKDYGAEAGINSILENTGFHDDLVEFTHKSTRLTTGDAYCEKHGVDKIDLLKVDVEGAEHLVFEGFRQMLSQGRISVIQFEYGYAHGDAKFLMKDFYGLLESYGYEIGPLKPNGVLFMPFHYGLNNFLSGPNYVAVHKSVSELISAVRGKPIKGFPSS